MTSPVKGPACNKASSSTFNTLAITRHAWADAATMNYYEGQNIAVPEFNVEIVQ